MIYVFKTLAGFSSSKIYNDEFLRLSGGGTRVLTQFNSIFNSNSKFIDELQKTYGIKNTEIIKIRLGMLLTYFRNDKSFSNFEIYRYKTINDILREGFYINETLNHMKIYFQFKQGASNFSTNYKLLDLGAKSTLKKLMNGTDSGSANKSSYSEFNMFYYPYIDAKTGKVSKFRVKLNKNQDDAVDETSSDYVKMFSKLQSISDAGEKGNRNKPSKFILIALVVPDLKIEEPPKSGKYIDSKKYCNGAVATLNFADSIASTNVGTGTRTNVPKMKPLPVLASTGASMVGAMFKTEPPKSPKGRDTGPPPTPRKDLKPVRK